MKLCVIDGDLAGHEFPIAKFPVTVGRSRSVAAISFGTDNRMSRCHCRIELIEGALWLDDLKSANGTWIEGKPVSQRTRIQRGQIVRVGGTNVCVLNDDDPVPAPTVNDWSSLDLTTGESSQLDDDDMFKTAPVVRALAPPLPEVDDAEPGDDEFDTASELVTRPVRVAPGDDPTTLDQHITGEIQIASPAELRQLRAGIAVLGQLAERLTRTVALDQIFELMADSTIRICPACRVVVLLPDSDNNLLPALVRPERHAKKSLVLSRTIVERAVRDRLTVIIEDTSADMALAAHQSIQMASIRSALCIPLLIIDTVRAVLYVDAGLPGAFSKDETDLVMTIGNQAALALSNSGLTSRLLDVSERLREAKKKQENLLDAFRGITRFGT